MAPGIVVMGVAGCGKTTVAASLARRRGARFVDADTLHPPANLAKMAAGVPLDDDDRWPWLAAVRRELRSGGEVVVACSALRRRYRDVLRGAGDVRFVHLAISREEAVRRVTGRPHHVFHADLVASQFDALEPPGVDERDVATVDAGHPVDAVVAASASALDSLPAGTAVVPLAARTDVGPGISPAQLDGVVDELAAGEIVARGARRVLLVPPDHTRPHARAAAITARLSASLAAAGCTVAVAPALGTHAPRPSRPGELVHRWRDGVVGIGTIGADEVAAASGGASRDPVPVEVAGFLLDRWDLVVSIGQVVPHEVVGMANFTKNLVVGLGGAGTIGATHLLSARCGIETVMGRAGTPVRDVIDAAFDRFLAPRVAVLWILTVVEDVAGGPVLRGLFAGRGGTGQSGGAAFRAAAALAGRCNVTVVDRPLPRVSCWLDPGSVRTTWLGNKAVYRTRMALADGGELVVLAPGVSAFGEDPTIDGLIRRTGYRGTAAVEAARAADPVLAAEPGAVAHLVHGSTEGRFTVVYCTDPAAGGLPPGEVEAAGYRWRPLGDELAGLGVDGATPTGERLDATGDPFFHVANPALGLWTTRAALSGT